MFKSVRDAMASRASDAMLDPYSTAILSREDWQGDPNRWDLIRARWENIERLIQAGARVSPYWANWDFTPIEQVLWDDLRFYGLPFYPQVPVGRSFVDFGDPVLRIALEADGRDFHDRHDDTWRDQRLYSQHQWRVFRVSGSQIKGTASNDPNPFETTSPEERDADWERFTWDLYHWAKTDSRGVVWAIHELHYRREPDPRLRQAAIVVLKHCHLADWGPEWPGWSEF